MILRYMFQHGVPYCRPHHAGCRPRHWQDGLQPGVAVCRNTHNPSQPSASRIHIPRAICVRGACSLIIIFTNKSYPFYMLNILWLFNAFFFHHGVDVRRCISGNANFIWKTVVHIRYSWVWGIRSTQLPLGPWCLMLYPCRGSEQLMACMACYIFHVHL